MLPPLPRLQDYDISPRNGFLPDEPPLAQLSDPYYGKWEAIVGNLQALLLSKRLRGVVRDLPIVTACRLRSEPEWRRAYLLLSFMTHAYVWGGDPEEILPPCISIPYKQVCRHLELPTVATYSGVVLWNWRPIFGDEPIDSLTNLTTLSTFTGSLDESWFYSVSAVMEARAGPTIPLMIDAIAAVRDDHLVSVVKSLQSFAVRLEELGRLLVQMYENCDPHVFYHRIRPYLAGSKNMADAGLPRGLLFDTGENDQYVQYGGGSNAQSSLLQFCDIILGIEHRPTGSRAPVAGSGTSPPSHHNFIHDMRTYMPGPHRRFLEHVSSVANIRDYVNANRQSVPLCLSYDACLAALRALREKHIQMVSRYIIVKSREAPSVPVVMKRPMNLARASTTDVLRKDLRGTGGTALMPFLKQARDETSEPAMNPVVRRVVQGSVGETGRGHEIVGLTGTWTVDASEGGLCIGS